MLLLLFLIFLIPVAIYCLVLAILNRRWRPTMVAGFIDCLGMLLAGSGFLLGAGPGLLDAFFTRRLQTFPLDPAADLTATMRELWLSWWIVWVCYFVAVLAGAASMLLWRRHVTVIYNVEPGAFEDLFRRLCGQVGLAISAQGQRWLLLNRHDTPVAEVDLEAFAAMCHVTLHWHRYPQDLRRELEDALEQHLAEARAVDNPAAGWFLALAAICCTLIFLIVAVIVLVVFMPVRRW